MLLALIFAINTALNYIEIISPILAYIGGTSFIFIVILYIISYVFKFCYLYRIPLYYITLTNIIGVIDKYMILSLSNIALYRLYFIITGITIIAYIAYAYYNRNDAKIDYIKNLCERYNCLCRN